MALATLNNALIVYDGKLAENCVCCVRCVNPSLAQFNSCANTAYYQYGPITFRDIAPVGEYVPSRQTIAVPENLSLPVTVFFCGAADDGFAIDGIRISRFAQIPAPIQMPSRTFTLSIFNDNGPIEGTVRMCFIQANPLP
jgi:hypothetical protein